MSALLTGSTVLRCTMGLSPSALIVNIAGHPVTAGVPPMPVATTADCIPITNIATFGLCTTLLNPAVQAATTAASGVFTPAPCVPVIASPWAPPAVGVAINGVPAVTLTSKCACTWSGVIGPTVPKQVAASAT